MSQFVNLVVVPPSSAGVKFQNSRQGDALLYTEDSNQAILIGTNVNGKSDLTLSSSNITVSKHFVPNSNETLDLGASNLRFRDLYLSGNTIDLGGIKLGRNNSNNLEVRDSNQQLRRLVVDQIILGDPENNPVVLKKSTGGALDISTSTGGVVGLDASQVVTGTLSNERLPVASTTSSGVVTLLDSTTSSSTSNAATPNAVKSACDIAAAALSRAGGTLTGALTGTSITTTGDVVVGGNFTVNGTSTTIDTQQLLIEDNLITLNKNQTGTPASFLQSGIEVERGDQPNYMFVFDEATDLFKVGISNQLQAVSTRDDGLTAGYPYFDEATSKLTNKTFATTDFPDAVITTAKLSSTTGTGSVALSNSPTFTGTVTAGTINATSLQQGGTTVSLSGHTHDASTITTGTMATARLPAASTIASGIVTLSDSTATTSSVLAATSTAVKSAYDTAVAAQTTANTANTTANAALPKAGGTMTGTLTGTTINATTLQQGGTAVSLSGHTHDASAIATGTVAIARLPAASTVAAGIVTLSDSTSTTSSVVAATSTAAKNAYDTAVAAQTTANAALPKAGGTMTGTLTGTTINATTHISIGANAAASVNDALHLDNGSNAFIRWSGNGQTGYWFMGQNNANAFLVYNNVNNAGVFMYAGNTAWNANSDRRMKKDIVSLDPALDKVLSLHPVTYHWSYEDSNARQRPGFIAQEVENVLPEVVDTHSTDMYADAKAIRVTDMIPFLVKAIQEQQVMIQQLQARVDALQAL